MREEKKYDSEIEYDREHSNPLRRVRNSLLTVPVVIADYLVSPILRMYQKEAGEEK